MHSANMNLPVLGWFGFGDGGNCLAEYIQILKPHSPTPVSTS